MRSVSMRTTFTRTWAYDSSEASTKYLFLLMISVFQTDSFSHLFPIRVLVVNHAIVRGATAGTRLRVLFFGTEH